MKAPDILAAAAEALAERGRTRDKPSGERSMGRAVVAFNALRGHALTEADGWAFMEILKIARGDLLDDCLDGAAYAALRGEAATEGRP